MDRIFTFSLVAPLVFGATFSCVQAAPKVLSSQKPTATHSRRAIKPLLPGSKAFPYRGTWVSYVKRRDLLINTLSIKIDGLHSWRLTIAGPRGKAAWYCRTYGDKRGVLLIYETPHYLFRQKPHTVRFYAYVKPMNNGRQLHYKALKEVYVSNKTRQISLERKTTIVFTMNRASGVSA